MRRVRLAWVPTWKVRVCPCVCVWCVCPCVVCVVRACVRVVCVRGCARMWLVWHVRGCAYRRITRGSLSLPFVC